jgi:hypothetical protein
MASLKQLLGTGDKRGAVIEDACRVLDAEVADKRGLTGLAIKGGYKLVQGIRPGFVREVVDHLLDEFLDALDPMYQEAIGKGEAPGAHILKNTSRIADALLAVTDARAARAKGSMLEKAYAKLRPLAKNHVEAAAPRLGLMLERHTR